MGIPLNSVVQRENKILNTDLPSQSLSEMLCDLNNTSIVINTIAAYILFSIYRHRFHEVKGLQYMHQGNSIAWSVHMLIETYFL